MGKILKTTNGYEVISNDGEIKVILQQTTVFTGSMETELYIAHYYVKEGTNWLRTNTTHAYESEGDFIGSIKQADSFSQAIDELRELLSGELSDDRPHGGSYAYHYVDDR